MCEACCHRHGEITHKRVNQPRRPSLLPSVLLSSNEAADHVVSYSLMETPVSFLWERLAQHNNNSHDPTLLHDIIKLRLSFLLSLAVTEPRGRAPGRCEMTSVWKSRKVRNGTPPPRLHPALPPTVQKYPGYQRCHRVTVMVVDGWQF